MGTRMRGEFSSVCILVMSDGHLVRAVLEGVTFALRDSLELMRGLGVDATETVAVGGGARSVIWRQMQADVLGAPVVTVGPSGGAPSGGSPLGAAVLAAVGSGGFATVKEACRGVDSPTRCCSGASHPGSRTHMVEHTSVTAGSTLG